MPVFLWVLLDKTVKNLSVPLEISHSAIFSYHLLYLLRFVRKKKLSENRPEEEGFKTINEKRNVKRRRLHKGGNRNFLFMETDNNIIFRFLE